MNWDVYTGMYLYKHNLIFCLFSRFRLSYYPHRLNAFTELLKEAFGEDSKQYVLGDFQPYNEVETPSYYIHVIQKPPHAWKHERIDGNKMIGTHKLLKIKQKDCHSDTQHEVLTN